MVLPPLDFARDLLDFRRRFAILMPSFMDVGFRPDPFGARPYNMRKWV